MLKSIVDSHCHSLFSADSKMLIESCCLSAMERGLGGIAITDHIDIDHPNKDFDFTFNIAERSKVINELRSKFYKKIKILDGLEFGFQPQVISQAKAVIKKHEFDFIICSIHVVNKCDFLNNKLYENKTKYEAYHQYLTAVYESVCDFDSFDVVGHIGYVCRYAPYDDKSLKYNEYKEILDSILKRIIKTNKGIEVNTAGFAYGLGFPHPDFDIIKRYHELGGSIITIGSDAHSSGQIGSYFVPILKKLSDIGFKYIAHFEKRKPIFVKI